MKQKLSDRFIATVKPPKTGRDHYSDLDCPNLVLRVTDKGKKFFLWDGRLNGEKRRFTLGQYGVHDLDGARKWANDITQSRDFGVDLVAKQEQDAVVEAERQTRTCEWLFKLYMESEGNSRKMAPEKWRQWNVDLKEDLGEMLVDEVTYDDLAAIIKDKFEYAPVGSNGLVSLIKRWWKWSVTVGRPLTGVTFNPSADLMKLAPAGERTRNLNDYEIGLLFRALTEVDTEMNDVIVLMLYLGVRRSEAFKMAWAELDELDTKGLWLIPRSRTKNNLDFVVPLPAEMVQLLKEQRKKSGNGKLVWPNRSNPDNPMSGFSKMLNRIRKKMEELAKKDGREVEHWSIHDLRRTLSSGMNGLHDENDEPLIRPDIVERVINHKIGGVAGIYNRYEYMSDKRKALKVWADHLNKIRLANKLPALPIEDQREAA